MTYETTFKPPLSLSELEDIQHRNIYHEDLKRLLWEIARMRAVIRKANAVAESCKESDAVNPHLAGLRDMLDKEPCVLEHRQWQEDLLNPGKI